jgi:hypothetical protein
MFYVKLGKRQENLQGEPLAFSIYIYGVLKQLDKGNARGTPSVFSWGSPSLIWKIIFLKKIDLMAPPPVLFQPV